MKTTSRLFTAALAATLSVVATALNAQVPIDFTGVTTSVYDAGAIAPGYVFLASCGRQQGDKGPFFLQIMRNDGTSEVFKAAGDHFYAYDFKVLSDGRLFSAQYTNWFSCLDGGPVVEQILDEGLTRVDSISMGNGYQAESHDFEFLPNGHVLLMGYYTSLADLRSVRPGSLPLAEVSGTIIQELDGARNVVWQWRTWDHLDWSQFSDWGTNCGSVISGLQANAMRLDPFDGNLLLGFPSEQMKINRQTGDVMWRLGGTSNQFSFAGVAREEGLRQVAGHDFHRLTNGNYILFNNGAVDGSRTSQVHEYKLDETNKVATHVWQYIPTNTIATYTRGSVQRLPNGNTFIGWGSSTSGQNPDCTEVTPDGRKVFELSFNNAQVDSYRAFRFPFPSSAQAVQSAAYSVGNGNTYSFTGTGVRLDVGEVVGDAYNSLTIAREPYAPLNPSFSERAPRLLPVRVTFTPSFITSVSGVLYFDPAVLSLPDPANLRIFARSTPGQGSFGWVADAIYDEQSGLLAVPLALDLGFEFWYGEFAFGIPDLAEVAFAPLLLEPEGVESIGIATRAPGPVQPGKSYAVNEQLPISLAWCPRGFADGYHLQIATNSSFSNLVLDQDYLTETRYVLSTALTNTTYFWRVRTIYSYMGDAEVRSDWATNAFATVPPSIHLTAPNGGEVFLRGRTAFVQWDANIVENVAIDLYKAGAFLNTIASSIPSTLSYQWQIGSGLTPGADYTLRIRSVSNAALFDMSDLPFSIIDSPAFGPGSITTLPDWRVRLNLNVLGAPQVTVFVSTNLSFWELLQTVPLTNGIGVFTDDTATNHADRFYRFSVP